MRETLFQDLVPVDGDSFCVTDDALVDFCLQDDVPVGQGGDAARMCLELEVNNGSFTKNLFKRLVDVSGQCHAGEERVQCVRAHRRQKIRNCELWPYNVQ